MIAYVKAVQAHFGKRQALTYNTYILSALVIFFLQMRYELPSVDEPTLTYKPIDEDLEYLAIQYYLFYAVEYERNELIICPHTGVCYNLTEMLEGNIRNFQDQPWGQA